MPRMRPSGSPGFVRPAAITRRCPSLAVPSETVMGGRLRADEGRSRMHSNWMRWVSVPVAAALVLGLAPGSVLAGGTLRIAMTASDVPTTTGAPDNGYEGVRFLGYPVYEGLVLWDLQSADKLADIRPGLAERWEQDAADKTKWVFHLRKGVKFHDGSEFNADAAIWNLDRYYKKDAKQFDPPGA